ncbi:MAG: hypothetical protein ACSLE2_11825 [Lysobacterales bacterium]
MLRAMLLIIFLLTFDQAFGSFFDKCEFDAVVVGLSTVGLLNGTVTSQDRQLAAVVKITSTTDTRSQSTCQDAVDRLYVLQLADDAIATVRKDDTLRLRFEIFNGLTPDGFSESITWSVADSTTEN